MEKLNSKLSGQPLGAPSPTDLLALDGLLNEVIRLSEEKVSLATRAWERMEGHVRRLDDDIVRFETEYNFNEFESLKDPSPTVTQLVEAPVVKSTIEPVSLNSQPPKQPSSGRPTRKAADKTLKRLSETDSTSHTEPDEMLQQDEPALSHKPPSLPVQLPSIDSLAGGGGGGPLGQSNEFSHAMAAPSNSLATGSMEQLNEPKYCYCNQVSFGEMIACDNEDCEVEWFHYECVGLVQPPKGQWYCNECVQKKKKGLIK